MCSRCSRSMACVKNYLHQYVEQPSPNVVFGDSSSCITEGYGLIKYGGIVLSKVAFVNGLKYNLISISQLYDVKYIVQFDDKQGTIFNANKEIMLIAPRINDVYVLYMPSLTPNGACFFAKASKRYSFISKAFRVFNTIKQQIEETYHVTFDEIMEDIRFINTLVDEVRIDDSSRYTPDEFLQEDDPSRQYQENFGISYYIIPHGHSLTELTQENHVPEVIALNEQDTPHTEDV
ncbi:hypothetical protein Tco_0381670 [Tanacetum coccineum]